MKCLTCGLEITGLDILNCDQDFPCKLCGAWYKIIETSPGMMK